MMVPALKIFVKAVKLVSERKMSNLSFTVKYLSFSICSIIHLNFFFVANASAGIGFTLSTIGDGGLLLLFVRIFILLAFLGGIKDK
jgi:hypothetical protein